MGLKDYFLISSKTRVAKKKLEAIDKTNLEKFLKKDFDKNLTSISTVQSVFSFVGTDGKTSVEKFAKELDKSAVKLEKFVEAIKDQAKSAGTKKDGLFYRFIYTPLKDLSDEKTINSFFANDENIKNLRKNIKLFLLAKKDREIEQQNLEEDMTDDDKNIRRKHNSSVINKLQSKRISNVLKVFMALVLWEYISSLLEPKSEPKPAPKSEPKPDPKPEPKPGAKPGAKPQLQTKYFEAPDLPAVAKLNRAVFLDGVTYYNNQNLFLPGEITGGRSMLGFTELSDNQTYSISFKQLDMTYCSLEDWVKFQTTDCFKMVQKSDNDGNYTKTDTKPQPTYEMVHRVYSEKDDEMARICLIVPRFMDDDVAQLQWRKLRYNGTIGIMVDWFHNGGDKSFSEWIKTHPLPKYGASASSSEDAQPKPESGSSQSSHATSDKAVLPKDTKKKAHGPGADPAKKAPSHSEDIAAHVTKSREFLDTLKSQDGKAPAVLEYDKFEPDPNDKRHSPVSQFFWKKMGDQLKALYAGGRLTQVAKDAVKGVPEPTLESSVEATDVSKMPKSDKSDKGLGVLTQNVMLPCNMVFGTDWLPGQVVLRATGEKFKDCQFKLYQIVQAASQTNGLESTTEEHSPLYVQGGDATQGPTACSQSLSAWIKREAMYEAGTLPDSAAALLDELESQGVIKLSDDGTFYTPTAGNGNEGEVFYKNGYIKPTELNDNGKKALAKALSTTPCGYMSQHAVSDEKIGVGDKKGAKQFTLSFAGAMSYQDLGWKVRDESDESYAMNYMWIYPQYENILKDAMRASAQLGKDYLVIVHLTGVGQGAFNNPLGIHHVALIQAVNKLNLLTVGSNTNVRIIYQWNTSSFDIMGVMKKINAGIDKLGVNYPKVKP